MYGRQETCTRCAHDSNTTSCLNQHGPAKAYTAHLQGHGPYHTLSPFQRKPRAHPMMCEQEAIQLPPHPPHPVHAWLPSSCTTTAKCPIPPGWHVPRYSHAWLTCCLFSGVEQKASINATAPPAIQPQKRSCSPASLACCSFSGVAKRASTTATPALIQPQKRS